MPEYCNECEHVVEAEIDHSTGICPFCGAQVHDAWVQDEHGIWGPPKSGIVFYTNAPAVYDYGRTTELRADTGWRLNCGIDQDKPVRQILIDDAYYAGIQKDRNLSGLYVTLTEAEFREWIGHSLVRAEV
jgi:hypothetical protein